MFSMCGLLCRFLRGWRQHEAVGIMVHAASLREASLLVENITDLSKSSSNLPEETEESMFCQPFCVQVEDKRKQLLWRDNNKLAILVSPKEKVDLVKWTGFLSSSPTHKDKSESSQNHTPDEGCLPRTITPISSRKNSTCSDCENIITVLLEASFREKEEETLYGYNVLVEQLAEPYAWKSSDVFGIIIHTTPTKLVTMIHAFFNNALIVDEDLCIRKIITVDLIGEPSTYENPSTMSEPVTPGPPSSTPDIPVEPELLKADSVDSSSGIVTTFEAMKREGLKKRTVTKANGSIASKARHPSLLEAKKLSSQSSEEDGSQESDAGGVDFNQLCPRGWAVSGLKPRSSLGMSTSQRVILGQPLSLNRNKMRIFSSNEMESSMNKHFQASMEATMNKHFQASLFTSVIPNPLNEFFAVKEALNQKMQNERNTRQDKDKNRRAVEVHKKRIDKFMNTSFTNPVFQYLPRFQKTFHSRSKDELGFSPKLYNRDYILKQDYLQSDSFKRRFSVGKGHNFGSSPEPKVHSQPSKVKSEADLLKATNLIKHNLANIIENYLTKSPRVMEPNCNFHTNTEWRDPEVLLISDDKKDSESILMVTVDESDLKMKYSNSFEHESIENLPQTSEIELKNYPLNTCEFSKGKQDGFYLNDSHRRSDIPNVFNINHSAIKLNKETNIDIKSLSSNTINHDIPLSTTSSIVEPKSVLYSMLTEDMMERHDVENQESLDSDAAEHSFSEDSLNEKVTSKEQCDESDNEIVPSAAQDDKKDSYFVSRSVRPKLTSLEGEKTFDSADDIMHYKFKQKVSDIGSQERDTYSEKISRNISNNSCENREMKFDVSTELSIEQENEISPLDDSVKSICNSISFEDNSFSEDSLLNGRFSEDQNPVTVMESKMESLVSTPEDFTCKTDSVDNLSNTEFPMHWHEEYVRIFSNVNQDLRESIYSTADLISNTLEPIAEMELSSKDSATFNEIHCDTEIGKVSEGSECFALLQPAKLERVRFSIDDSADKFSVAVRKNSSGLQPILETSPLKPEDESVLMETIEKFELCLRENDDVLISDSHKIEFNKDEILRLENTRMECRDKASTLVSMVLEQAILMIDNDKDTILQEKPHYSNIHIDDSEISNIVKSISQIYNSNSFTDHSHDFLKNSDFCDSKIKNENSFATYLKTDEILLNVEDENDKASSARGTDEKYSRFLSSFSEKNTSKPEFIDKVFESDSNWNNPSLHKHYDMDVDSTYSKQETVTNENNVAYIPTDEMLHSAHFNETRYMDNDKYHFFRENESDKNVHDFSFTHSSSIDNSDNYLEMHQNFNNSLPLSNPWDMLPEQFKSHHNPTSLAEGDIFRDFAPNCVDEVGGASGFHSETSPLLRSGDDSFVFGQIAKAMLSPVDSASESGFASLKDSSHSEATSESGSGVPLSKSKDSLDMTDSERDRTSSGVHTLLDEFDAAITGDLAQTGSSPASMVSSARGSLMEDLVFGHSKELEVLDIENVKIPAVHNDLFPANTSPLAKRGKLMSVASLDSDHRYAGYKFLDRFHSSQRRIELDDVPTLHHPCKKSLEFENASRFERSENIVEKTLDMSCQDNFDNSDVEAKTETDVLLDNITCEHAIGKCKVESEESSHLTSKSGSEDSGSQAIQTSDSISSSDTIISRASFDDQGKTVKDQSLDETFNHAFAHSDGMTFELSEDQNEELVTNISQLPEEVVTDHLSIGSSIESQDVHPCFLNESLLKKEEYKKEITADVDKSLKLNQDVLNDVIKNSQNKCIDNYITNNKFSSSPKHLSAVDASLKVTTVSSSKSSIQKPKSFEEVRRKSGNIIEETKPLSKSLSGEANVLNGKIIHKHGFRHHSDIKSSCDSVYSLRDNEGKISSQILKKNLSKSSSSERSSESNHERSLSSRSSTQTSSGSGEINNDQLSLKSQDSLDKFSYFESICAQAKPRGRRKKVLSVEVESVKKEDADSIHRSATLPEGSFAKSKDEIKKQKEEKVVKRKSTDVTEKERKSTLQSLKGFLKRNKSKETKEKDTNTKKTSPSIFRKFEKKKGNESPKKEEKRSVVISHPTPILAQSEDNLEEPSRIEFSPNSPAQKFNDKTHHTTSGYPSTTREGVMKMGIKSTLHRSNALASSAYVSYSDSDTSSSSNRSTPNTSPLMRKSNLNGSPRLYRKVLLRNVSSSQESIDGSPPIPPIKNLSTQSTPRRASESASPVPLMGTKALMSSPKNFSVTIGFKPQVDDATNTRTLSVGDNLHNMSSSPVVPIHKDVQSATSNLTKRSSSMEILVYGKIREHNPSRKRSSGGCSREGSFKLHREISVETLVEIPETYPQFEEGETENYQEYLQRVQESRDSRQSSTWSLCENEGSLSESMPLEKFSTHFPFNSHTQLHKKFSLPHNMHLTGPEEVSTSNPNLSRVGSSLTRGMPLSSSFTASPYKRPLSNCATGVSPIKRGISNQGKNTTSPGCDSCPASPLFEEEEDFECVKADSVESRPPNILVYTANNQEYFESVKDTLLNALSKDSYAIYHLTDEAAFKSPWKLHTKLLVLCGDVPTHVSTIFIRYLLFGGQVFSICSDFLNVAVPLFGTVEVQEAAVVSMSYNKWKNVQLLHHQHCFHSSPKHKRFSRDLEKKVNTGSAVSVEPTFVEITDEYGVRHRLNLKVLAKDDTWGAPSLLVANVNENSGKAIFSQVHLERDPNQSISCELKGEQLKKSNESRLEILRDLLSSYLGLKTSVLSKDQTQQLKSDYTPAFMLGRHEIKQKFMADVKEHLKDGRLERQSVSVSFHNKEDQCSIPSESLLPILLTGYPKAFSTVKYYEELKTSSIGRLVIFCEVLSSTQNIVGGKMTLEHGTAVIAMQQKAGRGRYGNVWLSPLGCAMFSVQLHIPLASNMGQCLPFLQHLIALSIVTGVTRIPGYEAIPLRLKWPNDVYIGNQTKIGGLIVEASVIGGRVVANAGCGVNLWNGNPTSCINDAIKEFNAAEKKKLPELSREVLCANIFNQMEKLLQQFQDGGAEDIIKEYYKYWLHGNARVTVQNEIGQTQMATVVGIDQFGYLKAVLRTGEEMVLHPDGNSFNMMEGLIYSKVPNSS